MAFQESENRFVVPAGVPKLHCHTHPCRHSGEEVIQSGVVPNVTGRQLNEEHAAAITQFMPTRSDALKPGLRRV